MKKILLTAVAVFAAVTATASAEYNKYNEASYINISNCTLSDAAEIYEMSVDEFKKEMGLPEDMPADTNEISAYYSLTLESYAKLMEQSADDIIEFFAQMTGGEKFDKNTLFADAEDKVLITKYFEPMTVEEIKNEYGLEDDITEETRFGEVRNTLYREILSNMGTLKYFDKNSLLVMLNGRYMDFEVAPVIINDRAMVPMRAIFEALDSSVQWDGETQVIIATHGDDVITMQVGQNEMFLNSEKIELDAPSVIIDERTLVPLRAVAEALNTQVFYNPDTKTVVIH